MATILDTQDVTGPTDASGFITVTLVNANPQHWVVTPVTPNTGTHPFIAATAELIASNTIKVKCYFGTTAPDDHSIASIGSQTVRFMLITTS